MSDKMREAINRAAQNAESRRGEVVLHASDWLAIQDALAAIPTTDGSVSV
jgi:hypothetical protein